MSSDNPNVKGEMDTQAMFIFRYALRDLEKQTEESDIFTIPFLTVPVSDPHQTGEQDALVILRESDFKKMAEIYNYEKEKKT